VYSSRLIDRESRQNRRNRRHPRLFRPARHWSRCFPRRPPAEHLHAASDGVPPVRRRVQAKNRTRLLPGFLGGIHDRQQRRHRAFDAKMSDVCQASCAAGTTSPARSSPSPGLRMATWRDAR
jgi:hypothetical protein